MGCVLSRRLVAWQLLHNLISIQPCHNTRSSSMVALVRPCTNQVLFENHQSLFSTCCILPLEFSTELREPCQTLSPSRSPPITHGSSSSPFHCHHSFILSFWTEDLAEDSSFVLSSIRRRNGACREKQSKKHPKHLEIFTDLSYIADWTVFVCSFVCLSSACH